MLARDQPWGKEAERVKVPTALIGCQVWRTTFDYQVSLTLVAQDPDHHVDAVLIMETPFQLRDAAGEWHDLDPGTGSRLAPVLDLHMKTITAVEIRDHGALSLSFHDGTTLLVSPHPQYESWKLNGHGVDGILVGPGGDDDWQQQDMSGQDDGAIPLYQTRGQSGACVRRVCEVRRGDADSRVIVGYCHQPCGIARGERSQVAADEPGLLRGCRAAYLERPGA